MALAAAGFIIMATWGPQSLHGLAATVVLLLTGFGFGLAIAPVNAALLASTTGSVHGVASALLVVARMVGMLVGISALTTIGLHRFYAVAATVPPPDVLCPAGDPQCPAYLDALQAAGLAQIHAIFVGAAICAVIAAAFALMLYRRVPSADLAPLPLLPAAR
jgi:ABC-type amino acid transport system permease subunit